ncbi:zinc-finger homeodomain protein 2 isoform X3 [Arachis ipaensis]|uniref:zinc-finger homeodomain protein 2 isoform X3 n=1 Tax=Arachis ipaensis TaxID=130454 RepID=UPI000A2B8A5A|nr:zinc-finger homeodomain protein 2 isoform X3 [Arachis ipaensis]XP_025667271.1 zinc-finger homeodomain protein 2 isoform X2 [Arachis hypogaea]
MEFDEHEDQEEEEMGIPEPPPAPQGYDSFGNSAARSKSEGGGGGGAAAVTPGRKGGTGVRYRECQKNHAVSIGGHAVDGCCEFLAAGEEGTLEAVICAACNCHRNFHRKEIDGETSPYHQNTPRPQQPPQPPLHHHQYHQHHQFSPYYHRAPPPPTGGYLHLSTPPVSQHRPLALPAAASGGGGFYKEEEDMSNPSSSGGGGGGSGSGTKKRFRTKFTQEQKDKMLAFAEQLGWRIQKHDESAVENFCAETGVKRHVLKVWMHNNKHTLEYGGERVWHAEKSSVIFS